ncbi:hypothetical protein [Sphingopyxis fribergensis]
MGWLGDLLKGVVSKESVDMLLVRDVGGKPAGGPLLVDDECYVEFYVNSLRLRNVRKFATRFDGVVYSFITLPFEGDNKIRIPSVSKPANLEQLDPGGLAKVITVDKQMMGAVPWRGGPMLVELGLFSVKAENLVKGVLDFVTEIADTAGVSFVGRIAPFAPLIVKGMDLLAGQSKDVALEVGLDTALPIDAPGTHAIIAVSKKGNKVDPTKLSIDPADQKLLHNGQPLGEAYCVFSVRRTDQKADFGEIPILKERYAALMAAIRSGKADAAKEALSAFRLAAIASPDLITKDANRLIARAAQKVTDAFGAGGVAKAKPAAAPDETLAEIDLYPR